MSSKLKKTIFLHIFFPFLSIFRNQTEPKGYESFWTTILRWNTSRWNSIKTTVPYKTRFCFYFRTSFQLFLLKSLFICLYIISDVELREIGLIPIHPHPMPYHWNFRSALTAQKNKNHNKAIVRCENKFLNPLQPSNPILLV